MRLTSLSQIARGKKRILPEPQKVFHVVLLVTLIFHLTLTPWLENAVFNLYTVPNSFTGESPCDFQELRGAK